MNFYSIYVLKCRQKIAVATLFFSGHVIDLQATKIIYGCICVHLLSRLKIVKTKYMISCGSMS